MIILPDIFPEEHMSSNKYERSSFRAVLDPGVFHEHDACDSSIKDSHVLYNMVWVQTFHLPHLLLKETSCFVSVLREKLSGVDFWGEITICIVFPCEGLFLSNCF